MNSNNANLTPIDAYALARALIGLPIDPLPLSPVAGLLLTHLDPAVPDDMRYLRKVLGHDLLREVLAVDPSTPPPDLPQRAADLNIVPELPESARLSPSQVAQAQTVGRWLDDYLRWAGTAAHRYADTRSDL